MFYLAFKFTFGNSLFCCCFFFSAIFLLTVAAWLGVWGSLRLGEMVGYTLLCDVNCGVTYNNLCYFHESHGCFSKKPSTSLSPVFGGLWGQEGRLTLRSEQSSSWGLQGAALSLLEGRSPGICAWTLPHQMAFEHQLFAMPCVSSCVYQDEKDSVCLQGTQIRSRIPKASKFPLKD